MAIESGHIKQAIGMVVWFALLATLLVGLQHYKTRYRPYVPHPCDVGAALGN